MSKHELSVFEYVPPVPEREAVGRAVPPWSLVACTNPLVVFKDEEHNGTDRQMTERAMQCLDRLAVLVSIEWAGVKVRVTESYDTDHEHSNDSVHYEGRALDLTVFPIDSKKLGRLAALAIEAGFDWVLYENIFHVHVSVKIEGHNEAMVSVSTRPEQDGSSEARHSGLGDYRTPSLAPG